MIENAEEKNYVKAADVGSQFQYVHLPEIDLGIKDFLCNQKAFVIGLLMFSFCLQSLIIVDGQQRCCAPALCFKTVETVPGTDLQDFLSGKAFRQFHSF